MKNATDEKLKTAADQYGKGCNCAQAVFSAFAEDMGIAPQTALRMMEGFGCGMGGMQGVCGALSAACAIISYYCCDGTVGNDSKTQETYKKVQRAFEVFQHEYGGITCREILHGEHPRPFQCCMKVKDAVLMVHQILAEESEPIKTI